MECEACGAVSCGNLYCALCIHRMSVTEESKVSLLTSCYRREEQLRFESGRLKAELEALENWHNAFVKAAENDGMGERPLAYAPLQNDYKWDVYYCF